MKEPLVDLIEDGAYFILEVALPGILETDIDVMLSATRLVLHAERRGERGEYLLREIERGILARELRLPCCMDFVDSKFEDGLLRLRLKRTGES